MAPEALYIHVPYCASKCLYCDFDSRSCRDAAALDRYAAQLSGCLRALGERGALAGCRTAYLGGGTPSLLGDRLPGIVRLVRACCPRLVELTCEANPESMGDGLAGALAAAGATRVSLGVQSLDDRELRALGRLHSSSRALDALAAVRAAGLDASIDLMCGIPHQTPDSWRATLEAAVEVGAGHVSVYPLTIEEDTPFARRVAAGALPEPDEDLQAWCMEEARRVLGAAGLTPYEVASYALPGKECRHNIAYWTGVPYLGLGRSAASMLDADAYRSLRGALGLPAAGGRASRLRFVQLGDGFPLPPAPAGDGPGYEVEELDAAEAAAEDLMLGMRMTRGVDEGLLARAADVLGAAPVEAAVRRALDRGLAAWRGEGRGRRLAPTERGWLQGNELFSIMWDLASGD